MINCDEYKEKIENQQIQKECSHAANCAFFVIPAGAENVGEYSAQGAGTQCCGDDANEYLVSCLASSSVSPGCQAANDVCCDENSDCTYGNACYTGGFLGAVFASGIQPDKATLCHWTKWYDCDFQGTEMNEWVGMMITVNQPEGCSLCGGNWVNGGESGSFGEYTAGTSLGCCGDDASEYYAQLCTGVTGVERKCCNSATDCIDAGGNCFDPTACGMEGTSCAVNGDCCQTPGYWTNQFCSSGHCCPSLTKWVDDALILPYGGYCQGGAECSPYYPPWNAAIIGGAQCDNNPSMACCQVDYGGPTSDCLPISVNP